MSDERSDERDERTATRSEPEDANQVYSDDSQSPGYDTDFDSDADPHDPTIGDEYSSRSLRDLVYKLTHAEDIGNILDTVRRYGWTAPIAALLIHSLFRGTFEFLTEPHAMSQDYFFTGWELALLINIIYGIFLVGFTWFLYFGVIGSFAGFFSEDTALDTTVFKVGGYLMLLFVPAIVVGGLFAVTISVPEAAITAADPGAEFTEAGQPIADTSQMYATNLLFGATWIVVGFLLIPLISRLYDVSTRVSVLTVLPMTMIAVVVTQFV